jgi:adenylate cyclase
MRLAHGKRLRLMLFGLVAVGSISAAIFAYGIAFFENFEAQAVDTRFTIRGDTGAPKDVVDVHVDDVTFSDMKVRWPFNRTLHAALLDRIRAGKPKAVVFDIQFSELGTPKEDNALGLAIQRANGKVSLSSTEVNDQGDPNLIFDPAAMRAIGARAGNGGFRNDRDGAIRHVSHDVDGLESLALVSAEIALGHPITKGDMGGGEQWIAFAGPPGTVTAYTYSRVMPLRIVERGTGARPWKVYFVGIGDRPFRDFPTRAAAERFVGGYQLPVSIFRDKIVVIGASAPALQDVHRTATGNNMPGPEIQANAIESAMRGFPLRSVTRYENVLLIIVLGLVPALAGFFAGPLVSTAAGIFFAGLFAAGAQLAFNYGKIASFVYPMTALALSTVGALGAHYTLAAFERERVRDVFSRFVPEQVVDQVLSQTDADLRLLGKEVVGTVMFSDLRGFTASAEEMPARDVIQVLNHYLHEMSEAILAHGGTLLCYMGDGIFALFGAPMEQEDHADRALAASREMLTERLPKFNDWMREEGFGEGYLMGIGLNTGPVMTGNVGHARRMDYTAVGDVTNTASRIEGMTKATPYSVLIAESTIQGLSERPTDIVFYDELEVRGRHARLKLWALDILKPDAPVYATPADGQAGAAPDGASREPAGAPVQSS